MPQGDQWGYLHRHLGHFTYECKDTRPYVSRPSRTAQLANPQLLAKSKADGGGGNPSSVDVPENKCVLLFFCSWARVDDYIKLSLHRLADRSGTANRILEAKEKQREKEKETDRVKKRTKRYVLRVILPTRVLPATSPQPQGFLLTLLYACVFCQVINLFSIRSRL
jgi:hypothetical protein